MSKTDLISVETISQKIFIIRGIKVMLDEDLAEFYQITTGNLNLAVQRNQRRFPADFMFQLTTYEYESLILQFARAKIGRGGRRNLPYVFSEHGVAMLSSVLKSDRAIDVNIFIIHAFIKLRELLASNKELTNKVEWIEKEQRLQNTHINAIYRTLDGFIKEPVKPKEPIKPKEPLGFRKR